MAKKYGKELISCKPRMLPRHQWVAAGKAAMQLNPANRPRMEMMSLVTKGFTPTAEHLAVAITKYWHTQGVRLTVGFLDGPEAALREKILLHMNAWGKTANVLFTQTANGTDAQVRIARQEGGEDGGYWS